MNRKIMAVALLLVSIALTSSIVSAGLFDSDNKSDDLNVSNIEIKSEGYSMYKVNCDLTPKKDFNYLEMEVIFYDSSDAVVGKSPLAWNINDAKKDQLIKVSGNALTDDSSARPVKAEVKFKDSSFSSSDDAIYSENVTMS
ncbi:MAG: hypothetical protein BZ136_07375 [Methanosphaera sp. rholeuAM74]|nr:MAG: hypothetical protein BZ136_07375 [Methanosphaera sp. rholeuAM74]